MFYLTSKFHDNRVNTFGFMEGGEGVVLKPLPPGPGAPKKPRRNRVNSNMGKESSLPRIGIRIGIN